MLERYFVKPTTIDRIRGSWIAAEIETYVAWLVDQGYSTKSIWRRVPIAFAFGEFAGGRGASAVGDLPAHVEAFVADGVARHDARTGSTRPMAKEVRGPVEQLLSVVLDGFEPTGRPHQGQPFAAVVPGFFDYLLEERGLRPASLLGYRHHLDRFEAYLQRIGVESIRELSPAILAAFVVERAAAGLAKSTVRGGVGVLRVFLRYAWREGIIATDLGATVGCPQVYRLSSIPRSISWDDVNRVLAGVERRSEAGRRDYAILLLLVTYGLRGREVAALTLDDIDWKRERLAIPERKAGHCTAFPSRLSSARPCSTTSSMAVPRRPTAMCSSEPRLPADQSGLRRCPRLPALTCSRRVSRSPGRDLTPCATRRCSAWSMRTST